ncbi:hypothetical protein GF366_04415, partial [Candidatus Peregrinibacteria bacterium]|nr:hypothetical protein [Candidatus Peregrinibacteria bacterium]
MNQNKTKTEDQSKAVFSEGKKIADTPAWLKDAGKNTGNKIAGAGEDVVDIRADKPSPAQLGADPSSIIEVKPSLEVISKAEETASERMLRAGYDPLTGKKIDVAAAEKMAEAGYDPETGKKVEGGFVRPEKKIPTPKKKERVVTEGEEPPPKEKTEVEKAAKKKKSLFDRMKSAFVSGEKKKKDVEEKVDKKGKGEKISEAEKKKYIEAEKIYDEGLASIKDLIASSSMEIKYDSIH